MSYQSFDLLADVRRAKMGNPSAKMLLMILAEYCGLDANEGWSCYPSQARLAAELEFSERKVRALLAEFEVTGLIERVRRTKLGRGRTSDRITLNLAAIRSRIEGIDQPAEPADQPAKPAARQTGDQPADSPRPTGRFGPTNRHAAAGEQPVRSTRENTNPPSPPQAGGSRPWRWDPPLNQQAAAVASSDPLFGAFWRVFPRREGGKPKAAETWLKATVQNGVDPQTIVDAASAFAAYVKRINRPPEKIPHATTWLHQGRWGDDLVESEEQAGPRLSTMGSGERKTEVVDL